ncbi:MAG: response regulator transcription factor [Arenibacterium sp.]
MDDPQAHVSRRAPTPGRPLLGLTILVVEDSRYASEAMRLLCLRSGARIRRADCIKSARRHLQVYRPSAIVADLGLPDGSGLDLIRELDVAVPRVPILLATSADLGKDTAALEAGADGFLEKPVTSLAVFQTAILSRLPPEEQPTGPRQINDETIFPDPLALQDDLEHVADVLNATPEEKTLDYVAQFVGGLARSALDRDLEQAASDLAQASAEGRPLAVNTARIAGLVQDRLQQKRAI